MKQANIGDNKCGPRDKCIKTGPMCAFWISLLFSIAAHGENWIPLGEYRKAGLVPPVTLYIDVDSILSVDRHMDTFVLKSKSAYIWKDEGLYKIEKTLISCAKVRAKGLFWEDFQSSGKKLNQGGNASQEEIKTWARLLNNWEDHKWYEGDDTAKIICQTYWNKPEYFKKQNDHKETHKPAARKQIAGPDSTNGEKQKKHSIPLRKRGGVYEAMGRINGELKVYFVVDSGAADVTLSHSLAKLLLDNGSLTQSDILGQQKYHFANGMSGYGTNVMIRSLEIGGHTIRNVKAVIMPGDDVPLLLGQSALSKFSAWSLNSRARTLDIIP